MNTTTMFYVGIDVSKDKSDICIKDENGNDLVQRFKITNNIADFGRLHETIEIIKSSSITRSGNISKRGSLLLRQALFLAANIAIQNDEKLKRFYAKKKK